MTSFEIAQVIVRKGKAYILLFGETSEGESINIEPVCPSRERIVLDPESFLGRLAVFDKDRCAGPDTLLAARRIGRGCSASLGSPKRNRADYILPTEGLLRATGART